MMTKETEVVVYKVVRHSGPLPCSIFTIGGYSIDYPPHICIIPRMGKIFAFRTIGHACFFAEEFIKEFTRYYLRAEVWEATTGKIDTPPTRIPNSLTHAETMDWWRDPWDKMIADKSEWFMDTPEGTVFCDWLRLERKIE